MEFARKRIVTDLAGRTVWCASAHSEGGSAARRLRGYLAWADGDGVAAAWCEVPDTGDAGNLVATCSRTTSSCCTIRSRPRQPRRSADAAPTWFGG